MDLDELWRLQADQQLNWYNKDVLVPQEQSKFLKDLLLQLYEEVAELQRAADQDRHHLLKRPEPIVSNILEQGVDVTKVLLSILQLFGVSASEFAQAFRDKTAIVQDKWSSQNVHLERDTLVFATDLDGCVVDMSDFDEYLADMRDGQDQRHAVEALEAVKDRFYVKGGFMDLPPIAGAIEALRDIKGMGYTVVVVTARPYWQYKRLYSDTMNWARANGLEYDHIIFNKDKAEAIWEFIHPARPRFFVEDRSKHALELVDVGVPVLLFDTPRNRDIEHPLVQRVTDWRKIADMAQEALK